ncbi:MAG: NusG domain II-containing protein [Lachnospirales bacterium]
MSRYISKNDIILAVFFILSSFTLLGVFALTSIKVEETVVNIYYENNILKSFNLSDDVVYTVNEDGYYNEIKVLDGVVMVEDANCKDGLCVSQGSISKVNETILCLPNKVLIEIEGSIENESELDGVVS